MWRYIFLLLRRQPGKSALASGGSVPGVLLAWVILAAQRPAQNELPVGLVALGVVLLLAGVSALATLPALRAMSRVQVVDVLRAE